MCGPVMVGRLGFMLHSGTPQTWQGDVKVSSPSTGLAFPAGRRTFDIGRGGGEGAVLGILEGGDYLQSYPQTQSPELNPKPQSTKRGPTILCPARP